jgi:hypothetical protein
VNYAESLEASSEFKSSQADVVEAAARVRAHEQALAAAIKALGHDRDRCKAIDSQLEGYANILLTVGPGSFVYYICSTYQSSALCRFVRMT